MEIRFPKRFDAAAMRRYKLIKAYRLTIDGGNAFDFCFPGTLPNGAPFPPVNKFSIEFQVRNADVCENVEAILDSLSFVPQANKDADPFAQNMGDLLCTIFKEKLDDATDANTFERDERMPYTDTGQLLATISVNYFSARITIEPIYSGHIVSNTQLDRHVAQRLWDTDVETESIIKDHTWTYES